MELRRKPVRPKIERRHRQLVGPSVLASWEANETAIESRAQALPRSNPQRESKDNSRPALSAAGKSALHKVAVGMSASVTLRGSKRSGHIKECRC